MDHHQRVAGLIEYASEQVIKRREAYQLLRDLLYDPYASIPHSLRERIKKCLENKHVHGEGT